MGEALICRSGITEKSFNSRVAKSGDTMTGVLNMGNTNDYIGVQKIRSTDDGLYYFVMGVGSDADKGGSGSLRLTTGDGTVAGRLDIWENGELTYMSDDTDSYLPLAKYAGGSYTGSGVYGSTANANSLTFKFVPQLVVIESNQDWGQLILRQGQSSALNHHVSGQYVNDITVTWSGNKVTWYSHTSTSSSLSGSAGAQCNNSGTKYYYFAIG